MSSIYPPTPSSSLPFPPIDNPVPTPPVSTDPIQNTSTIAPPTPSPPVPSPAIDNPVSATPVSIDHIPITSNIATGVAIPFDAAESSVTVQETNDMEIAQDLSVYNYYNIYNYTF